MLPRADVTVTLPVPRDRCRIVGARVPAKLADHVLVFASPGERGMWLTTKGLGLFGLPELQSLDVPDHVREIWAGAMTGIALKVLERWIEATRDPAAFVQISAAVELSAALVARAYQIDDANNEPVGAVELRLDPSADMTGDSFLTIEQPEGVRVSHVAFMTQLCRALLAANHHR